MREVDESERYLGTKVDNMWWMNRCDMEVGQGNMPDTHVIQDIHINNLEKLSRRPYYSQVREHQSNKV